MIETKHISRLSELQSTLAWLLFVQVVLLMLTALFLDGGYSGRIFGCAMGGYWLMVGWVALRRSNAHTKTDTVLIRSGFFGWLVISFLVQIVLEHF